MLTTQLIFSFFIYYYKYNCRYIKIYNICEDENLLNQRPYHAFWSKPKIFDFVKLATQLSMSKKFHRQCNRNAVLYFETEKDLRTVKKLCSKNHFIDTKSKAVRIFYFYRKRYVENFRYRPQAAVCLRTIYKLNWNIFRKTKTHIHNHLNRYKMENYPIDRSNANPQKRICVHIKLLRFVNKTTY